MKVILNPKPELDFQLELDQVIPDNLKGKSPEEIGEVPVYKGSKELELTDVFEIDCEDTGEEEVEIVIDGDIPKGKRVGQDMSEGKIKVNGDVGMYVGAFMSGGKIEVEGDADAWAGQKMSGGELEIKGDAEEFLGATYRGDWIGMTDGKIVLGGDASDQVGEWLDGGQIEINGDAGIHLGYHMKSGAIVVDGDLGARAGSEMEDGDIVVNGELEEVLPGFSFEEEVSNPEVDGVEVEGNYLKFTGDKAEEGEGSLYLNKGSNEHLIPS